MLEYISDCLSTSSDSTYGIDIGVWVLGLSMLSQDTWSNLVDLGHQLEHRVLWQFAETEFSLGHVSRIRLSEHGVTIARDDTATVQGLP